MGPSEAELDAKQAVLESLAVLFPWMRQFYSRPIRDYACRLFEPRSSKSLPDMRLEALRKLVGIIKKAAARCGVSTDATASICKDFEKRRVLQTGPHLLLLLEKDVFCTHLFSLLGLSAHGGSSYITCVASTVKLVESARKGPGWLIVDGKPINVFGLGRSRMRSDSLLSGPGNYRFELIPAEPGPDSEALEHLRAVLPTQPFDRPADAIKAANLLLWPKMFGDRFAFLQLDDGDFANLVADHLLDGSSWLRTWLLDEPGLAAGIIAELDKLAAGPWRGWLIRGTDFFWAFEAGKRMPLRLVADELVHPATGMRAARFAAADILEGLASGNLIPNLFVTFLVLSILPEVRVLGGSHQPVYYPLIRYVLCRALETAGIEKDLRDALASDDLPSAWGHRVWDCGNAPWEFLRDGGTRLRPDSFNRLGDISFVEGCGALDAFVRDASWQELHRRLREQTIAPADDEWAFS